MNTTEKTLAAVALGTAGALGLVGIASAQEAETESDLVVTEAEPDTVTTEAESDSTESDSTDSTSSDSRESSERGDCDKSDDATAAAS